MLFGERVLKIFPTPKVKDNVVPATANSNPGPVQGRTAVYRLYCRLLAEYGPQGWWPLLAHPGVNPTKTGSCRGYHPGDYSFPHHERERFEICCGAILTQNTAWPNVEAALLNLDRLEALEPGRLLALTPAALRQAIRPAGYYNVKAEKLQVFARFHGALGGRVPTREELLALWGVGPETADSIRLYAYGQVEMVVAAYTRRALAWLGLVAHGAAYGAVKAVCVRQLPADVRVYQEFHALMVELGKRYFSRQPHGCPWLQATNPRRPRPARKSVPPAAPGLSNTE